MLSSSFWKRACQKIFKGSCIKNWGHIQSWVVIFWRETHSTDKMGQDKMAEIIQMANVAEIGELAKFEVKFLKQIFRINTRLNMHKLVHTSYGVKSP